MALALLFEDSSVMYLDAVTNYTKSYSSGLSSHPIDGSAVITDHVARDNPSFSIKGVISAADFHAYIPPLVDSEGNELVSERAQPVNPLEISAPSSLLSSLPGSVQQFLSSTLPVEVSVDDFRGYSHQAARDRLNEAWERSEILSLIDYDFDHITGRSSSIRMIEDCLIQNYTDSEDAQTGDSFDFTITFQQVRFAYLKEVDIQVTHVSISDSAAGESDEGEQRGTESSDGSSTENAKTLYLKWVDPVLDSFL